MPITARPSESRLPNPASFAIQHQLFNGTTWHSRLLPSVHKFAYPYRYWGVNISALAAGQALPEVATSVFTKLAKLKRLKGLSLFSAQHKALQRFCPADYIALDLINEKSISNDSHSTNSVTATSEGLSAAQALEQRLQQAFIAHTGSAPVGDMLGLLVCRNAGLYFSPVNFYLGFDNNHLPSHLLAEVSNTPWNKRHYYGFLLEGADTEFCHDKDFHVSPFNPIDQQYRWQVSVKPQPSEQDKSAAYDRLQIRIAINISDARGEVLKTGVKMSGEPMTAATVSHSLRQNPLMNVSSLSRIYWHAFKLYAIKKVPYINYDEKLADSQQQAAHVKKTQV